jgi:hypothetical protein
MKAADTSTMLLQHMILFPKEGMKVTAETLNQIAHLLIHVMNRIISKREIISITLMES